MSTLFVHTPYSLPDIKPDAAPEGQYDYYSAAAPTITPGYSYGSGSFPCTCSQCNLPWAGTETPAPVWSTPVPSAPPAPENAPWAQAQEPAVPRGQPEFRQPPAMRDQSNKLSDEEASNDEGEENSLSSESESPDSASQQGKVHPCLLQNRPCDRVECPLAKLPSDLCIECLLGEFHSYHSGKVPQMHPCLRVWGQCKYGPSCIFANFPRVWCLYCLRHQKHSYCDGLPPKHLPVLPTDIAARVTDHEQQKRLVKGHGDAKGAGQGKRARRSRAGRRAAKKTA